MVWFFTRGTLLFSGPLPGFSPQLPLPSRLESWVLPAMRIHSNINSLELKSKILILNNLNVNGIFCPLDWILDKMYCSTGRHYFYIRNHLNGYYIFSNLMLRRQGRSILPTVKHHRAHKQTISILTVPLNLLSEQSIMWNLISVYNLLMYRNIIIMFNKSLSAREWPIRIIKW